VLMPKRKLSRAEKKKKKKTVNSRRGGGGKGKKRVHSEAFNFGGKKRL